MEALIPAGFPAIVRGRNPRGDLSRGNLPLHLEGPGDVEYSPLPRVFHGGAIHDARGRERFLGPGSSFRKSLSAVAVLAMDSPMAAQVATRRKKMTKQLMGKRDDTAMHAAARAGQLGSMRR